MLSHLPFLALHDYNVVIAIVFVIFITILNLRGVTESASVLAYPVYLFVLALFILIGSRYLQYCDRWSFT